MRSTFIYICNLVKVPFYEDVMARDHTFTFVDGRVLSLQDGVAVALRMLNSGEPPVTVGSSVGVDEPTASLLTQRFIEAFRKRAGLHHARWPHSSIEMEKIKRMFEKIHGLPNCCGIVHTAQFKIGSKIHHHGDNDSLLSQLIVDPYMRFTDLCSRQSGSINQCSILHDSHLFKECEEGVIMNGSKLKVSFSGGTDVGEYIIGDAGYPLRPWLLTPYKLENGLSLSESKVEFNRRHSAATAVAQRALARLKDTWKCLQGEGWNPDRHGGCRLLESTIHTCYLLHNIVIDMEEEDAGMLSDYEQDATRQVRQIENEDAIRVRDALSQYLIESGVHTTAVEEEQQVPAASSSGDENKEQAEAFQRQRADRGKEKVQDY